MINITREYILKELKTTKAVSALSIFSLVGFLIPFIPFGVIKKFDINSIISFLFLLLVFGLPFGYFIGIKNIKNTLRVHKNFKSDKFSILVDKITDIKVSKHGRASEMDDNYCKLYLEKYSLDGKSTVAVYASVCRKLKKGDSCVLVFVQTEKYPVLVFPGNNYSVDKELDQYII